MLRTAAPSQMSNHLHQSHHHHRSSVRSHNFLSGRDRQKELCHLLTQQHLEMVGRWKRRVKERKNERKKERKKEDETISQNVQWETSQNKDDNENVSHDQVPLPYTLTHSSTQEFCRNFHRSRGQNKERRKEWSTTKHSRELKAN